MLPKEINLKENLWRVSHSFSSLLIIVEKSPEEILIIKEKHTKFY